jgi:hypothetical protein
MSICSCFCQCWELLIHHDRPDCHYHSNTDIGITPTSQPSTLLETLYNASIPISPSLFFLSYSTTVSLTFPPLSLSFFSLNPQVVYEWAKGTSFGKITEMTLTAEVQCRERKTACCCCCCAALCCVVLCCAVLCCTVL